ncbi:hypothetical protein ACO0OL_002086 [Hanseniaspora opuntiae]
MQLISSNKIKKKHFLYIVYSVVIILVFKFTIFNNNLDSNTKNTTSTSNQKVVNKEETIYKDVIMPLMPDLEKKQELGRHAWYLFHTVLSRYPDEPSTQQQDKLKQYINLFAEFYPCGECSYHFQELIKKNPVQSKSRKTAALWGCHIHNLVNEHLKKPVYDCTNILEDYDCGCGDYDEFNKEDKITIEKENKQLG